MDSTKALNRVSAQLTAEAEALRSSDPEGSRFLSSSAAILTRFGNASKIAIAGGGDANDPRPRLEMTAEHAENALDETLRRYIKEWLAQLSKPVPIILRIEADAAEEVRQAVYQIIYQEYPSVRLGGTPAFAGNPIVRNFDAKRYVVFRLRDAFRNLPAVSVSWDEQEMGEAGLYSPSQEADAE